MCTRGKIREKRICGVPGLVTGRCLRKNEWTYRRNKQSQSYKGARGPMRGGKGRGGKAEEQQGSPVEKEKKNQEKVLASFRCGDDFENISQGAL